MKAFLFLLCFIGVVTATLFLRRPVGHRHYLIMTKMTWSAAKTYCRTSYADLATVEGDLDWFRLKTEIAKKGLTDVAWVGLYNDINSWRWSFNDVPLRDTLQQWYTGGGQPDNIGGHETCGAIGPYGYWWDHTCTDLYPFICYNGANSYADRFVGVSSSLGWTGAQAYCREFHTDLATATTTTDNDVLQSIAFRQGKSWIGIYRDAWKWSDGTNTTSLLWLPGQPDNYYKDENCAVLNNGMFDDKKCNELHYFVCHTSQPMRENQIIKLKVKSDMNMIDSDLQLGILDLVKQKLDENGMLENTTVTWRMQSDGQVFHKTRKEISGCQQCLSSDKC